MDQTRGIELKPADGPAEVVSMGNSDVAGKVSGHGEVLAIPGSPPFFKSQICGAWRSTRAGLADLSCKPERYDDVEPLERINIGDCLRARVDQAERKDDCSLVVMGHTAQSGVGFVAESSDWDVARGDEIELQFDSIEKNREATILGVVSTDDRVRAPTLTSVDSDVIKST